MDFIVNAHKMGGVFVHCLEGVSRSICVVLCYLVQHNGWIFENALMHMRSLRPHIDIFPKYLEDTRNYLLKMPRFIYTRLLDQTGTPIIVESFPVVFKTLDPRLTNFICIHGRHSDDYKVEVYTADASDIKEIHLESLLEYKDPIS